MLMLQPQTFGKRYNVTGKDYWSEEGYVDTRGHPRRERGQGVRPIELMDDIYADRFKRGRVPGAAALAIPGTLRR